MTEQNNYYAIIPAKVRYDKDLAPNAKLLYGEIFALCREKGYCWATNSYFADLYGCKKTTVSAWISALKSKGYISTDFDYDNEEVLTRRITVSDPLLKIPKGSEKTEGGIPKNPKKYSENSEAPLRKKPKDNNTLNSTSNNTVNKKESIKKKTFEIPSELSDMWSAFVEHRKKLKKPLTDYTKDLSFNKLMKLSGGDFETANKILEQSIENGWQGLFELKGGESCGKFKQHGTITEKPTVFEYGETLG